MTPAIATPVEEIIRASRRVITGSGCEIAATKLCLWPHDQPEPSRLLLPHLLLIPPFSFLCCVCKFSDHLSPNTTAKNRLDLMNLVRNIVQEQVSLKKKYILGYLLLLSLIPAVIKSSTC